MEALVPVRPNQSGMESGQPRQGLCYELKSHHQVDLRQKGFPHLVLQGCIRPEFLSSG